MRLLIPLALAFLVGVLGGCFVRSPVSATAGPPPGAPAVANVPDVKGQTRPAPGRRALIAPTVLHPVVAVHVKAGDRVNKDQVLVKLDDDEPRADVRAKKAALESTRVSLRESHRYLARLTEGAPTGAIPQQTLHEVRAASLKAENDERVAKAALEAAEAELEHYTVTAPIDGVISWLDVVPGMVSRPGTSVWGAILDLSEIDVQCELPADQADRIAVGQGAEVRQEGRKDTLWTGEVAFVGVMADERTGLVPVRVRLRDLRDQLRCFIEVKVRFRDVTLR